MPRHLQRQIDKLKKAVLELGARVEQSVQQAIEAIINRDVALAQRVIEADKVIDEMEIDVEEECLHTLALYQPVADDLRFVVAVLKINNDLERIADLAANIAGHVEPLVGAPDVPFAAFGVYDMADLARKMVKDSLDALVESDVELARNVCASDDQVDDVHRRLYDLVEERVAELPDQFPNLLHMLITARQIERMADHAVNIAEDVLYLIEGEIVRHAHQSADA